MGFIDFCLGIGWKVLCITAGWMIIKWILKDGKETIKDLLSTIKLGLKAGGVVLRKKMARYLRKEEERLAEDKTESTERKAIEGQVDKCEVRIV